MFPNTLFLAITIHDQFFKDFIKGFKLFDYKFLFNCI